MATEVGSDIALIQDEDMLRKMWQQTEDFGKKKEIRMRMYKLREQRLKEFYTTGEMIQTETTTKRSSTRTHTESITDQGFMSMKTKEIRDSESPTEDYQRQSNTNKNCYVSSKIDESDGNRGIVEIEQTSSLKPTEEYTQDSLQTSMSSSASSMWKSSQTTISVSEEVKKADVNLNSKFIVNEQTNEDRQLTFDTSYNKSDGSNIDSKVTESISTTNIDNIKRDDINQYSNDHQKVIETYTSNNELVEPVSENISNKDSDFIEKTYTSNISKNNSENVEIVTDSKIINELHKLDSYLSTQQSTTDSTKSNSIVSNDDKIIKKVDDQVINTSKENIEDQYITTHQHSYQPPRISVDLSPSHEAFARSLRSTPERSSPSPCRERTSPERRFKSASPEKYRASPEKSGSPARSLNYSTRRKLSSTHTKGLSKKRSITPTRGKQYDSSDDSDCSGATHGTYDKYKSSDAKRTLFKEETKITSVSKYGQKSSSTSPVRREKSPGYSSEGSVGKEVRKSSSKVKNSSHESSPERSAFKPVNNYKTPQTQQITKDNKINRITHEESLYTNNYDSKNKISDDKHLIKVIKPEIDNDLNENECTKTATKNTDNNILDSKNKSIQEKFIIEEQVCTSSEQINNKKITTQPISTEKNKTPREKSPPKSVKKENKTKQDEFIEKEKSNLAKQSAFTNDDVTIKPKEKSPVKEVKPVTKDDKTYSTIKSTANVSHASDIKYITPSKKTISAIPSSIKKVVPSTLEKTPSKKSLIHKDVKDGSSNKTVKKDLSREKMDIKITRNDSKTLIHKNSKDRITPKTVIKKPSQELLVDKKTTISSRQKITSPETKPKIQETIKVLEKKDSKNKLKPSISPQSSQKKLGAVKSTTETKTVIDSKRTIGNINTKKIPSSNGTKPRTSNTPKSNINETPSKITKPFTKTISISSITKPQIKKTTYSNFNKTIKVEITKNVEQKSKDLEDELPPDNFESDTDLDDSTIKPKYIKNISSNSSTSSSSSEEDDKDEEDVQKIQDIDNIRNEAEEEYGKKMTNKDALLNVIVQLPPSSRESSPEYSARFGQPYCSVSDDASLPRYADVVSEPEDVNDYSNLQSNRYDVVTDLDEESSITVADRVSKFLNNVNKQEEIQKTTEIPQSPQAVRKTKQIFESIAKGKNEETDIINDVIESETLDIETEENRDLTKINKTPTSLLTRKISGASDYKSRKDFFENKKSNDISEKVTHLTPTKITRSSSIKERRASFETKIDKKTPLKDKTNVPRTKSPESKNSSPDRATKTPIKISKNETFDVKVEEINRSRKLSGSKTVKDRTATFEKNEPTQKSYKENKTTYRHQVPSTPLNTSKISETRIKSTTVTDTKTADRVSTKRVSSPEKTTATDSITKTNEVTNRKISSKSPDRKIVETPKKNSTTKSPERSVLINTKDNTTSGNQSARDTSFSSSRQRATVTTAKTDFGTTVKNISAPKTTLTTTTTKSISANNNDEEVEIEEIFDLHILEIMLEKAVGYDRRRRIRAQIRVVKRQLETNNGLSINTTTRVPKNFQDVLSAKKQNQSNKTVQKTEYVKEAEVKKERSVSPQKSYANPIGNSRSPSPQKTLKSVVETRTPLPTQKTIRAIEKERSLSPQKTVTPIDKVLPLSSQKLTPIEKARSPSPQKSTPTEKVRSPSPKKMIVVQQQQDSRFNKNEKSSRNSTITSTSTSSTTVTKTTKVKSDQVSSGTNLYQEQNVTDLITSSYGVGPTDDNGRPLFGLRALRKNNANQSSVSENDSLSSSARYETDSRDTRVSEQKHKSFGLKALQSENTYTVQESTNTVYQTTSEQKGGVDQLITDHKGKPLFGLRALQSIGKNEEEPIYDDMPEPPVSPQLKDLVLKHEKHAKESSKLDSQPRQKPKAKFRDSFILDTKDEGLYSTFEENGFTDSNQITPLRSINKKTEDDQNNETIVKSKSQSTVFQSKSVMRSDGSGNVSVTQDFLKGELSSVNDQEPSGKLTRGHYTYQSPDNSDAKKGIAKVTTVTTAIGKNTGPQITEITEELNDSDRVDGNKVVKRSRTNDKFENIQKRFSQESFNQDSRRSSKELNGHEKTEESPQSTPRSSLVRGDSIKALQHKFQQATVSSSLKQNRTAKSDCSRQVEEKTITTKVNATKNSGNATSFLDNNSRVTGVQDVLTRMRNADLVVESGDTNEDTEARALLNKFLGASVILHGMEQGNKSPASVTTTSSAALVNQVEKQRAQKSPVIRKNLNEQELDNIWDEKQLQILLESCPDYDQRRKIRARLRQIMAEHKACTDVVAQAGLTDNITSNGKNGELLKPMCNLNVKPIATAVDDSGTESGEEVNQKILVQVQGALANLESALPALDPLRRSSVVELLTKLQTSLKLSSSDQTGKPTPPPRKCWNRKAAVGRQDRHTVGVSSEELKDARRWLEENGYGETTAPAASTLVAAESARNTPRSYEVAAPKTFRPVKFVPPPPKRTNHLAEDCVIPEPSRHALQNCNSFSCPPAQHVIVEDLDCKRRKTSTATTISIRDSSESSTGGSSSPSSSSGDDDDDDSRSVSSAQRLLQIASNDHCRKFRLQGKRVKLKRGAAGERGRSSGDDDEYRSRRVPLIKEPPPATTSGGGVPLFEPKTANDKKYLAFLRQQAEADEKAATASAYNPLQGKLQGNWGNRFGRIKTTFERRIGGGGGAKTTASAAVSPNRNVAKTFWHDICKCPSDDSIAYYRSKKFPSFKPDTAVAPTGQWSGENRGFSHGARSAFKPVQQQQQPQQFAPVKSVPRLDTSLLGPPQMVTYPKHLPLYNSSVTTAHRPFVYSDASDDPASPPGPQHDERAPQPATVVSRVMGSPQTATIVKGKQRSGGPSPSLKTTPAPVRQPPASSVKAISAHHNNNHLPSSSGAAPKPPTRNPPRVVTQQRSPTTSPVRMPSVLQKSESWHQMIVGQSRAAARSPLPHIPAAAPLRHASAPYEGYMHCKREIAQKQNIVRQHLHAGTESAASACRRASPRLVKLNDDIDKVDDTFESLFKEATRPSK